MIVRNVKVVGIMDNFVVVFVVIGIIFEELNFFIEEFKKLGVIDRIVMFVNFVNDLVVECIVIFCMVIIVVEYLVYELDMYVLIIMIDIINYVEFLREILVVRKEVLGCCGYFGYMYIDFLFLYECVGCVKGKKGFIM